MSQKFLAQYLADCDDLEKGSPLQEKQELARELHRVVFETIVEEAVDLVELCGVDPFDAADWAASRHNYDDFEAILEAVREEVGNL